MYKAVLPLLTVRIALALKEPGNVRYLIKKFHKQYLYL